MQFEAQNPSTRELNRRTLVAGAAWSVPVLAAAAAAPNAAASCRDAGTRTWSTPGTYTFQIPACATRLDYVIRGGGGAHFPGFANIANGAVLTGGYNVASLGAFSVRLFVAGGGQYTGPANVRAAGGTGYSPGGASGAPNVATPETSAGGGGGSSALQISGSLAAVAGGGGGRGISAWVPGLTVVTTESSPSSVTGFNYGRSSSGASDPNGTVGGLRGVDAVEIGFSTSPAGAASGTTGGAAGGTSNYSFASRWSNKANLPGTTGNNAGAGGAGGNGATAWAGASLAVAGGGGGGGYAGGGGGGLSRASYDGGDQDKHVSSGSGGAGSSYSAASVAGATRISNSVSASGIGATAAGGHTGLIVLTWS